MSIKCPKCQSEQITSNKKGFGVGKAVAGAIVAGPIGLAAGVVGSSKVKITCLNCGFKWKAGEHLKEAKKIEAAQNVKPATKETFVTLGVISFFIGSLFLYWSISLFSNDWDFLGVVCGIIALVIYFFSFMFFTSKP